MSSTRWRHESLPRFAGNGKGANVKKCTLRLTDDKHARFKVLDKLDAHFGAKPMAEAFELLTSLPEDFMADGRSDTPAQVREDLSAKLNTYGAG
jgi:hypothetical protein